MTDRAPFVALPLAPPPGPDDGVGVIPPGVFGYAHLHDLAGLFTLCGRAIRPGVVPRPDFVFTGSRPFCCQRCRQILEGRRLARFVAVYFEQQKGGNL